MASVTQRVSKVQQPYGGYLPMKTFTKETFNDGLTLNEAENIHASLVGLAVDYLTRFSLGDSVDKAFRISCFGAENIGKLRDASFYKSCVTGLDDRSIIAACKLTGYDVCFRASPSSYKPVEDINPDAATIENIRIMVNRSLSFWDKYGPIECSEPTFEGGYTITVNSGDGDFLSKDTLWDFKVSKSAPTTKHSLQILMYYVMGLHSIHNHYKNIKNLGFFNPRLNIAYICPISAIPAETIAEIENDVICYSLFNVPQFRERIADDVGKRSGLGKDSYYGDNNKASTLDKSTRTQSVELSVGDICRMSGISKSVIYADIRSGKLRAYKRGNKYYILNSDYKKYEEQKETQLKILAVIFIVLIIAFILMILRFL